MPAIQCDEQETEDSDYSELQATSLMDDLLGKSNNWSESSFLSALSTGEHCSSATSVTDRFLSHLDEESKFDSSSSLHTDEHDLPELLIGCSRFWRTIKASKSLFHMMDMKETLNEVSSFDADLSKCFIKIIIERIWLNAARSEAGGNALDESLGEENMFENLSETCLGHIHVVLPITLFGEHISLLNQAIVNLEENQIELAFIKLCLAMAALVYLASNWRLKPSFLSILNHKLRILQNLCAYCFEVSAELIPKRREQAKVEWISARVVYENLINAEPYMLDWYWQRALMNYQLEKPENAILDMNFYQCVGREVFGMPKQYTFNFIESCNRMSTAQGIESKNEGMNNFLPFLTANYLNLLISFPCDDFIVGDLLAVRNNKADWIADSSYKVMLTAMSYGALVTSVANFLRDIEKKDQSHRAEGYLLLSLIFARTDHWKVQKFLDDFVDVWVIEQHSTSVNRRRKIFTRYLSISLGIRKNPLKHVKFRMFSEVEYTNFYMQMAFVLIWQLQMYPDAAAMESNINKLRTIKILCSAALKFVKSEQIIFLREYTQYELQRAENRQKPRLIELRTSAETVDAMSDDNCRIFATFCHNALCRHSLPENFDIYVENRLFYPLVMIELENVKRVEITTEGNDDSYRKLNYDIQDLEFQAWVASLKINRYRSLINIQKKQKIVAIAELANQAWPFHVHTKNYQVLLLNIRFLKAEIELDNQYHDFCRSLIGMNTENKYFEDAFCKNWSAMTESELITVVEQMQLKMHSSSMFERKISQIIDTFWRNAVDKEYPGQMSVPSCELLDGRERLIEVAKCRHALFQKLIQTVRTMTNSSDCNESNDQRRAADISDAISCNLESDLLEAITSIPPSYGRAKFGTSAWGVRSCFVRKCSKTNLPRKLKF